MNKKKILHIIDSLGQGGAEILLVNSINLLNEFEHVVVVLNVPLDLKKSIIQDYKFYNLNHSTKLQTYSSVSKLKRIIKKTKPSLIHAHLIKSTWIARLAKPSIIPFAFTIHSELSNDAFDVNKLSLLFEKLTYNKNQEIISVSNTVLEDYKNHIKVDGDSTVIYNFVGDEFFYESPNLATDNQFKLVSVGNLKRQKNFLSLLKAMKELNHLPISLDIYGDGSLKVELQSFINKHSLKVNLKGRQNNIHQILPNYNAYVLASESEGFGIAPIEAMAVGLPLILSNLEVFKEIANDKPIYFNPSDINSIKEAILYAFENKDSIKNNHKEFKKYAFDNFSSRVYKDQLIKVYNKMLCAE